MSNPVEQFSAAIAAAGLTPPETIEGDGKIHRFSSTGRHGDDSGWYLLHLSGIPAGSFGCWREGLTQTWCGKSDNAMTQAEREINHQRIKAMKKQRDAEQAQRQHAASETAAARWQAATAAMTHPYLTAKGIKANGARIEGEALLVPMRNTAGKLQSLQTIGRESDKRFLPGGKVKGCYYPIGKPGRALIVCEGFATGASIHEATGEAVAIAFNAGNLEPVATALHKKYPKLTVILAADDDWRTDGNPGLSCAKTAALAVGGFTVVPHFPPGRPAKATDFNDLAALAGMDAVRVCFSEIAGFVC